MGTLKKKLEIVGSIAAVIVAMTSLVACSKTSTTSQLSTTSTTSQSSTKATTSTKTTSNPTSGGTLGDILGRLSGIASVKYDMVTTTPNNQTTTVDDVGEEETNEEWKANQQGQNR